MLIQFRQGIVQAPVSPPFLNASGPSGTVNLVASASTPVLLDFAQGATDVLFQEASPIASAWSSLPASGTLYLYWDINLKTGLRTFGYTTLLPFVGPNPPPSPVNGQMWFNTITNTQSYYSFGFWNPVLRVLAGTYTGGLVTPYLVGSQIGNATPVNAGYILFDENNNPIKKYQTFNLGEFITTVSPLASQFSQIQNYNLESTVNTATASGNIVQWQAIRYVAADTIGVATSNVVIPPYGSGTPAIGVAPQNMANGTVQAFLQEGYITSPTFNFSPVGANVFINTGGFLTTTPPNGGTLQVMGYVVDSRTLFINPQQPIAFG